MGASVIGSRSAPVSCGDDLLLSRSRQGGAIRSGRRRFCAGVVGLSRICGLAKKSCCGPFAGVLGLGDDIASTNVLFGRPHVLALCVTAGREHAVAMIGRFAVPRSSARSHYGCVEQVPSRSSARSVGPGIPAQGPVWPHGAQLCHRHRHRAIPGTRRSRLPFLAYDHARRSAAARDNTEGALGVVVAPEAAKRRHGWRPEYRSSASASLVTATAVIAGCWCTDCTRDSLLFQTSLE